MTRFPWIKGGLRRPARAGVVAALAALLLAQPASSATLDRAALDCTFDKMRTALKESTEVNACLRRALAFNGVTDPACLEGAAVRLGTTFAKIEARGGCLLTGDAPVVQQLVDQFTTRVVQAVSGGACQEAGSPCGGGVVAPCCPGLACLARIGEEATCR